MALLWRTLLIPAAFALLATAQVAAIVILGTGSLYFIIRKKNESFEQTYDLLNNIMYLSCALIGWWLVGSDILDDGQ